MVTMALKNLKWCFENQTKIKTKKIVLCLTFTAEENLFAFDQV